MVVVNFINFLFNMLLPCEQQAILQNLPGLVADLNALDILDYLISTSPASLTTSDYENISTVCQKHTRSAGVRLLISCLLRRSSESFTFENFVNALRPDYVHLADLITKTYDRLTDYDKSNKTIRDYFCENYDKKYMSTNFIPPHVPCRAIPSKSYNLLIDYLSYHQMG